MPFVFSIVIGLVVFIALFIRQIEQYQRGVMYTLGKFTSIRNPGIQFVIPVVQRLHKVDIRVKAVDVPDQEAITSDNISIGINAVIYYKVSDAGKAVNEVENFYFAVSQLAQTTMRNLVGQVTLDDLLTKREEIANNIETSVDQQTDSWGIKVVSVELKDIRLPESLKRTMAKEAEAEREKRAVIINSLGELEASRNLAEAAKVLHESPGALHLRTLHTINDLSSDQSNTTIWMIPNDGFRAIESLSKILGKKE